ncbi:tripartite tricarboxylate transporter substrate binding protein [Terrabacter sp. MAHUQ-38]|uniref:Bug family tripartite tricarboxylate transporter substrate binding protein n=1 Tax=unclassified Terrabacter TaxID=2630222 RepID=UPI00165D3C67|nr:tripartite tricarboxylate transporter substrate binding protein [Terrabacter sp. MAHUQ-38]
MRFSTQLKVSSAILAAGLALSACGVSADEGGSGGTSAAAGPVKGLRILVPNSPGSGYDTTARLAAKAMQDAGLASTIEVFNSAGAGGTVGLQRLVNEQGKDDILMQMGLGVVGAVYTNKSKATLNETVPIARLIEESEAIVVPAGSPYQTLDQLVAAWKANPGKVPVGGASNPGGPDHLTPMLLAKAVGVTPKDVNYVAYDGGGELLTGILGKKVAFAATGIGEVAEQAKSGDVKILAVTSAKPVEGVDAPTLKSMGIDMEFTNWRGIVAPPGLSADKTKQYIDLLTKMHASEQWKKTLADQGWTDAFQTGDEFKSFLTAQNEEVAGVLKDLGLTS